MAGFTKGDLKKKLEEKNIKCNIIGWKKSSGKNAIYEKGEVWFAYTFTDKTKLEDEIGLCENEFDEIVPDTKDGLQDAFNCIFFRK